LHASTAPADYTARRAGIAVTVMLHVALLAALLFAWPAHRPLMPKAPMILTYIVVPVAENPKEPPLPMAPAPKPRPTAARPVDPPPVPVVASDSPTAIAIPASDSARPPSPDSLAAAPAAVPAPSAAPAVRPPSFDAAYLDNPAPPYPAIARRTGEQGRVLLRVLVSAAGTAESVEVRASSGSPRLDHAALETVRRWRFVPARQGGETVAAWVLVPISFTLAS
jgi:periplasmic protein TonB